MSAPSDPSLNENVRYETQDVRYKPLLAAGAGLLILLVAVALAVAAMFRIFAADAGREPPTIASPQHRQAANELQQLRQREDEQLGSYGWVSREQGIVRIPIDRAMELVIEESRRNHETR